MDANILEDLTAGRLARLESGEVIRRVSSEIGVIERLFHSAVAAVENRLIERILLARIKKALRAANSQSAVQSVMDYFRNAYEEGKMETLPSFIPSNVQFGFSGAGREEQPDPMRGMLQRSVKLLYIPGGGFILPASRKQKVMVQRLADATGCEVLLGAHRLAPENPFPAAPHDIAGQYKQLCETEDECEIFLAADTAGASIALGALQVLMKDEVKPPAGIILFSPWCDLSMSGWSYITSSVTAQSPFRMETAAFCARLYLQGNLPTDPLASAIFADPNGWPPMLIHTSRNDLHFDDAIKLAENYEARKGHIKINYWDSPRHHLERLSSKDAMRSFQEVAAFVGDVCDGRFR